MAQKKVSKVVKVPKVSKAEHSQDSSVKSSKETHSVTSKERGEPQTMEELLKMYGGGFKSFTVGEKVKAVITSIDSKRVLLNIGGKSEGLVAEKAYKLAEDFIKTLKPGDEVEGVVLVSETREGYTVLSLKQAAQKLIWVKIEKAYESKKPVKVEAKGVNPSGIVVDVEGLTGFIPISQLGKEASKKPQELIGTHFEAVVIDFDKELGNVILSEKEVSEAEKLGQEREAFKFINEGDEFEGEVTTIFPFGCFVRIEAPIGEKKEKVTLEGLVHISEISWDKVQKPEDVAKVGQKTKVKVIGKKNDKLAFSIKQTQADPWKDADKKYKKDEKYDGKVVKISDYGVFVSLEPGVEGLIHITKIPPTKEFETGDIISVIVEEIDFKAKKLSLGLVLTAKPIGYK